MTKPTLNVAPLYVTAWQPSSAETSDPARGWGFPNLPDDWRGIIRGASVEQ